MGLNNLLTANVCLSFLILSLPFYHQRKYDEREAKLKSLSANIKASMAAKDPGKMSQDNIFF